MDYYDNLIEKIESLLEKDTPTAISLIDEELKLPYVPRHIYNRLIEIKNNIDIKKEDSNISIDKVLSYLYDSDEKQLYASYELDEINLRQYIEPISNYLKGDGLLDAKLNIIISLIKQEINYDFVVNKEGFEYPFNPSKLEDIKDSQIYIDVNSLLCDFYMKSPDKLVLASELLYKHLFYLLPEDTSYINKEDLFNKITSIIEDSFK